MEVVGQGLRETKAQSLPVLVQGAGLGLAEVSKPELGPGVSFGCKIVRVCMRTEGVGWGPWDGL